MNVAADKPGVSDSLQIAGALTLVEMPRLLAETNAYVSQPALPDCLSIDFAEVSDVDSSGVALLLHWRRESTRLGKALRYINMPANLASLAQLYGVDELIHCPTQRPHLSPKH